MAPTPALLDDGIRLVLEGLTAASTAAAAIFSAVSAWMARKSARAAQISVDEARKARREELLPRLVLEKDFLDFEFHWPPHKPTLNGGPALFARKHWKDTNPGPPTFSLTNHGASPAIEIEVVFDLEDPNGELALPIQFQPLGISMQPMELSAGGKFQVLSFDNPNGGGSGFPIYRKWTMELPNCAPGQTRTLEFPDQLLCRLLLRGMQYWANRGKPTEIRELVLNVYLRCRSLDGQEYKTQFRFTVFPFCHGPMSPLVVNGHCGELPMYPRADDARVA